MFPHLLPQSFNITRSARMCLLTIALLLTSAPAVRASGGFQPAAWEAAYQLVTGTPLPPEITIRNGATPSEGGPLTTFGKGPTPGTWLITLYPIKWESFFNIDLSLLDINTQTGLLCGTIAHELQHKCIREAPPGTGSGESEADPNTCEHIAQTYGTLEALCASMTTRFLIWWDTQEPPSTADLFRGFCKYYRQKQKMYNAEGPAAKARLCKCEAQYIPPTICPEMAYPPHPPGSSCPDAYPNNVLIPGCAPCTHFQE